MVYPITTIGPSSGCNSSFASNFTKLWSLLFLPHSLKIREESWHRKLDSLPSIEVVVTNCILAAAFTVYCPILKTSQRHSLFSALLDICQHCGLPINDDHTLTPSSYPKFMIGEVINKTVHFGPVFIEAYRTKNTYKSA